MISKFDLERLKEIHETMTDLLHEAVSLVKLHGSTHDYEQAKAYWIGHIDAALGEDNFIDDMFTMKKTIESIEGTLDRICPQCNNLMFFDDNISTSNCSSCDIQYNEYQANSISNFQFLLNRNILAIGTFEYCCRIYKLKVFG